MRKILSCIIFVIYSILCSAQESYIVLTDGRTINGKIDILNANPAKHKSENDLTIETKINGKKTQLHFSAEEIKKAIWYRGKKDSMVYKPLQFRNDIFLCQLIGTKGRASIFSWVWDTGEPAYDEEDDENYEGEYILVSNDSIIEVNPRHFISKSEIIPKFQTFPRIPNKEKRKIRRETIKKLKKKYQTDFQSDNEILLQFINKRYNQHFITDDFKSKNIQSGLIQINATNSYSRMIKNMLNYIVNAENERIDSINKATTSN